MSSDRFWNKDELAEWLGVPVSWVKDAITRRAIPISWVGRHARFSPEDRAAFAAACREEPAPAAAGRAVRAARHPMPRRVDDASVVPFQPRPARRSA